MKQTFSVYEAAKLTGHMPMTLYERIRRNTVPFLRIPAFTYRIPADAIPKLKAEREAWGKREANAARRRSRDGAAA